MQERSKVKEVENNMQEARAMYAIIGNMAQRQLTIILWSMLSRAIKAYLVFLLSVPVVSKFFLLVYYVLTLLTILPKSHD